MTENDSWREDSHDENKDASRDGNRVYNRDGYNRQDDNRSSYNRDNSYNREGQQNRPYGERPRTPYNKYGSSNDRSGGYNRTDRPQRSYNRDDNRSGGYNRDDNRSGGYNREGGYNRDGGEQRTYRPRFNREDGGGNRSYSSDRPQRSYNRDDNRSGGYNRDDNRSGGYNREGGSGRPRFTPRPSTGGSSYGGNSSYNNRGGGDMRPRRPRFTPGGGDNRNQGGGYGRPFRRTDDYDPNAKYSLKKQIEYKQQYFDPNEPIRLNKFLANAGVCSRREADEFITAGVVTVNGEVVTELGTKIMRTDEVKFHEKLVSIERKQYILLNKPKDCVTTSDDPQSRMTVMDIVKDACNERIYPVGRLDRNTTGVLLLTNDGDLASKLTHPKFLKKKIYQVTTDKNVTKNDMDQIMEGIKLDEETEIKADSIAYADDIKRNVVGIEIHSGQNRIVRRIFESLGYRVIKLDRVYFAGLTKKGLRRGDWRYLTEREVGFLKMGSFV